MSTPAGDTVDRLLEALRHHTAIPELDWSTPPSSLAGGFWAEMYTVELANAPGDLAGRLVARIMPDATTAAYETAVQRHLHRCAFAVPAIRAADGPGEQLDRAWSLMDLAPGQPLLSGLGAGSALRRAPTLLRQLPDLLAEAAAALHRCPVEGLDQELERSGRSPDITDFLRRVAAQADAVGRPDLASVATAAAIHAPPARVVCHGDLHPFNLLVDGTRWTLIDWSTAVVADRHFDLAFTTLMLAHPPLGGPAPVRALARAIGDRLARRFLRTYAHLSGCPIDPQRLAWGRQVHALRALVEVASWEADGDIEAHAGHPWLALRPMFEAETATPFRQPG